MTLTVMAGLVPAIYAVTRPLASNVLCSGAAWMAGTSPAMTPKGCMQFGLPDWQGAPMASVASAQEQFAS